MRTPEVLENANAGDRTRVLAKELGSKKLMKRTDELEKKLAKTAKKIEKRLEKQAKKLPVDTPLDKRRRRRTRRRGMKTGLVAVIVGGSAAAYRRHKAPSAPA